MTNPKNSERENFQSQVDILADSQAFDPKQDVEEKRWLRREYRQLIQCTEENRTELVQSDAQGLVQSLQNANALYEKVKNTYEASLDSRFLIMSSDIGTQKAKMMRIDHDSYDVDEYFIKLNNLVQGSHPVEGLEEYPPDKLLGTYWNKLGSVVAKYSRRAPTSDFMFGPLLTEKRVLQTPRNRTVRQAKNAENLVQPQQLEENDIEKQENETTKNVKMIFEVLERVGPINLFEFIVNPESFPQTVENFFYLSFLIRDGRAYIDDDSGQPILESCMPPSQEDYADGLSKKQLIMEIDQSMWEMVIDVYNIKKSVIPTRKQIVQNVTGKWYG